MSVKRTLVPALLAVSAVAACASAPAGAVVNGTKVDAADYPWYVGVGVCGGTLVASDRALTAAHCVAGRPPAELGGVRIGDQTRKYTRFAMHPNWRQRNGTNYLDDVAIVELSAPIPGAVTVALGGADPAEAWILGQGRPVAPGGPETEATYDTSLRIAPLASRTDAQCTALFKGRPTGSGERYDDRMRCSIDADGQAPLYSGCNGDSGGPLFTGTPAAPVQLGVVSWGGDKCGADHLPSVFADVARYRGFILDPAPTWAPTRTGTVTVTGTATRGRRLTCSTGGYRPDAAAKVTYEWRRLPTGGGFDSTGQLKRPTVVGTGKTYKIAKADHGRRVACFVIASNDGGSVQVGVANRLVKG